MDVNNMENLHKYFGMECKQLLQKKHKIKTQFMFVFIGAVDDKVDPFKGKSLFTHENGRSSNFFFDASFQPIYEVRPLLPLN